MARLELIIRIFCALSVVSCTKQANQSFEPPELTKQATGRPVAPTVRKPRLVATETTEEVFPHAGNPFAEKSWNRSVEVASSPPLPPPLPTAAKALAPPLPFTYAGKMEQSPGKWTFYLSRGDESFALSKGDTFDNVYRLVDADASRLVIEYLPLSEKQTLPIGAE